MVLRPSDLSNRVNIPGGVSQVNDNSLYPTHYSDFGLGGLRTAANLTERGEIPLERQDVGMLVYVETVETYFKLVTKDTPDPNDPSIIIPATYEALQTGGSGQPGTPILEIIFIESEWVLNDEKTQLTLTLDHGLGTDSLNVDWYEDGSEGTVFVPWLSTTNSIIVGCIPAAEGPSDIEKRANAFTGLVRISSTVSPGGDEYNATFAGPGIAGFDLNWALPSPNPLNIATLDIPHNLLKTQVSIEIYDSIGNEQLMDIKLVDNQNATLTVDASDIFAGYLYVKG